MKFLVKSVLAAAVLLSAAGCGAQAGADAPAVKAEAAVKTEAAAETKVPADAEKSVRVKITGGRASFEGEWYDTELARELRGHFPITVEMVGFGGREYYGGLAFTPAAGEEGKLSFADGDITYCATNNTLAFFYAQTDRPDLTMRVVPVGRVTSPLAAFHELPGHVTFTIEAEEM